jgi:hypothetical protein
LPLFGLGPVKVFAHLGQQVRPAEDCRMPALVVGKGTAPLAHSGWGTASGFVPALGALESRLGTALAALESRLGTVLVWVFNVWGSADLLHAFYQGVFGVGLEPGQLGATYFIPTVVVPLLLITHGLMFRLLLWVDGEQTVEPGAVDGRGR